MAPVETQAPPVGEEIHMPEPSLVPIVNAVGLSLAIVGITLSLIVTVVGAVIFFVSLVRWILDARHEISELPADHRAAH